MTTMFVSVLVLIIGLSFVAYRAFLVQKEAKTLSGYFLSNRKLGPKLTNHNFWATSFALANGLAYFSTLGYMYGIKAALFQIPWFLSFVLLAWQVPRILQITKNKTLHKYLGQQLGGNIRLIAAYITLLATLSIVLYELHLSSEIVLHVLRRETVHKGPDFYLFVIIVTLLCIWYVDTGGFLGTAKTDKIQNRAGLFATCALLIGLIAAGVNSSTPPDFWQSFFAGMSGKTELGYESIPLLVLTGVLCYASVWNLVDPSNWQAWSANSDLKESDTIKDLRKETLKAAFKMLLFPCIAGVMIGVLSRAASIGDSQYTHFSPAVIAAIDQWSTAFGLLPDGYSAHELVLGIFGGLVCFGLFSLALSTIDSYLISASQTYCWDVNQRYRMIVDSIIDADDNVPTNQTAAAGTQVVAGAKKFIYLSVILALVFFELLVSAVSSEADVFVIQFLIGSMIVAVAPALVAAFALDFEPLRHLKGETLKWGGAMSILGGVIATALTAALAITAGSEFNAYAIGPIASLGISACLMLTAVAAAAILAKFRRRK